MKRLLLSEYLFKYLSKSGVTCILAWSPQLLQFQCIIQQGLTYIIIYACLGNIIPGLIYIFLYISIYIYIYIKIHI